MKHLSRHSPVSIPATALLPGLGHSGVVPQVITQSAEMWKKLAMMQKHLVIVNYFRLGSCCRTQNRVALSASSSAAAGLGAKEWLGQVSWAQSPILADSCLLLSKFCSGQAQSCWARPSCASCSREHSLWEQEAAQSGQRQPRLSNTLRGVTLAWPWLASVAPSHSWPSHHL